MMQMIKTFLSNDWEACGQQKYVDFIKECIVSLLKSLRPLCDRESCIFWL